MRQGLYGGAILFVFEILPFLKENGTYPDWDIRALHYGSRIVLTEVEGHLEISPATTPVRLVDHGGALVAVAEVDLPVLTAEQVRDAVEATRR